MKGLPIQYGLTIPESAPNKEVAEEFVEFLLSPDGQAILQKNSLPSVSPTVASDVNKVPARLRSKVTPIGGS